MKVLIVIEHHQGKASLINAHVASAAHLMQNNYDAIIVGDDCLSIANEVAGFKGCQQVYLANHPVYKHQLSENVAKLIAAQSKHYDVIIAPASTYGKNILPRVAALLDVNQISDVVVIHDAQTFTRPIYAGNVLMKVKSHDPIKVLTVRGTAFPKIGQQSTLASIKPLDMMFENETTTFISQQNNVSKRPELTSARVIVSGGRALKSAENFKMLEVLADKLGAAIGATRAAVDAGYVPNDYQVGQTGKIVSPQLYIAIGISGAIQHLAGMKDSKIIVAINKDEDAPIFKIADYRLVGDLFEIVPQLIKALDRI